MTFAILTGLAVIAAAGGLRKAEAPGGDWPANVAHQGGLELGPSNTITTFRRGLEAGSGGLELDVHLTSDGEVVVIHDDTVDRTTDGIGAVRNMSLAEIKRLDAGYSFTPDGKSHPERDKGVEIPTLDEVLREFPEAQVNIDIKEDQAGAEEAVWRVIRENDAEGRALVGSFHSSVTNHFREVSGGRVATAATKREVRTFYVLSRLRMEGLIDPPYRALQVPPRHGDTVVVTPRFVEAAHDRGVRVDVWTVNEASKMERLLRMGVDTIITDHPGMLAKILERGE